MVLWKPCKNRGRAVASRVVCWAVVNGAVVAGASGQEVPVVESSAEIVRLDVVVSIVRGSRSLG
jgi:hypothetical protein